MADYLNEFIKSHRVNLKDPFATALIAILTCGLLHPLLSYSQDGSAKARQIGEITTKRLLNAELEPGAWMTAGRDWQQSYYSPLIQITKKNVRNLGFAWSYETPFSSSFEATPIVVDGMMFSSGNNGNVYALDAKTGSPL